MKSIINVLFIATTALVMVGCASTGNNFDESKVSQIKKGITTEPELIQVFGKPETRSVNSEGQTHLTWNYAEGRVKGESFIPYAGAFMGGSKSSHKSLMVSLGADGTVTSFSSTAGGTETRENQLQAVPKN